MRIRAGVELGLGRRRIIACDVTEHPIASWAANVVRCAILAIGRRAKYLVRDRDDEVFGMDTPFAFVSIVVSFVRARRAREDTRAPEAEFR